MNRLTLPALALLVTLVGPLVGLLALAGCATERAQTPGQVVLDAGAMAARTTAGQNVQVYPDGSMQSQSVQADSGQIDRGLIDYQSTGLSAMMSLGREGVSLRNPGNFGADRAVIEFGEPVGTPPDGELVVPIRTLTLEGVNNEVTTVVEASTAQVGVWASALATLAPAQQEAFVRALERDERVAASFTDALREALGLAGGLLSPGVDLAD
jgi:hypothetical protein